jgi:hypothetical protein
MHLPGDDPPRAQPAPAPQTPADEIAALKERVNHLEAALEGLQDAVYRNAQLQEQGLADVRRQLQPENVARSLSEDARRRGL